MKVICMKKMFVFISSPSLVGLEFLSDIKCRINFGWPKCKTEEGNW